jgi:hypothetical protein
MLTLWLLPSHAGGLAAPAIAAGLGAAVTMVHGGAAAAAVVSGLGGSAVGTAGIASTFGVIGMNHAGSKTAALVSEVQELGFWDLSEPVTIEPEGAKGAAAEQSAGLWESWFGKSSKQLAVQPAAGAATGAAAAGAGPSLEQSSSGASSSSGATSQAGTSTTPTSTSGNRSPSFASRKTDCDEPPTYRPLLLTPVNPRKKAGAALALTIAVNGWVSSPEDYAAPWRSLPGGGCDRLALVWERDLLLQLGVALSQFIKNKAVEESGKMVGGVGVPGVRRCLLCLLLGAWLSGWPRRCKARGRVQGCN